MIRATVPSDLWQGALTISRADYDAMVAHCKDSLPYEACGMLGGSAGQVEQLYRMNSSELSPVRYTVDPTEQLDAMKDMSSRSISLVGIYHSHPDSPAMPSLTDINRAFFPGTRELNYPGVVYVIVGLSDASADVRGYRIGTDGAQTVEIIIS